METERKFLVEESPDLDGVKSAEIEQGYLALAGDQGGAEVRLRRQDQELLLTAKSGSGLSRVEEEIALERDSFEALWPLTEGRRLAKTRYAIPCESLTIELDVYAGAMDGLLIAEVEFSDEDQARAFEPSPWFSEEVTGRDEYLNETLATKGAPR